MPDHRGFEANEKADELTRKGDRTLLLSPEPACCINKYAARITFRIWVKTKTLDKTDREKPQRVNSMNHCSAQTKNSLP